MAYKPPNSLRDYFIGKYPGGITLYLISKEAWKNRIQQSIKISITTVTGNSYPLTSLTAFNVAEFDKMPEDWDSIFQQQNLKLRHDFVNEYFSKKSAVKSEPTPDDYYLVKHGPNNNWRAVLRKAWDKEHVIRGEFFFWVSNQEPNTCGMHNEPRHKQYWIINNKKFPQLSSEVKAELQKLNPERYKEWEDFYIRKYPNMQPLKPIKESRFSFINPNSVYILDYGVGTLYIADQDDYNNNPIGETYSGYIVGDTIKTRVANLSGKSEETKFKTVGYHFPSMTPAMHYNFKRVAPELYQHFEQYYSELEQKKELKYQLNGKNPNDFYFYTVGRGWEAIRKEAIDRYSGNSQEKVLLISIRDGSTRYVRRCDIQTPLSIWSQIVNDHPSGKCLTFKQQNEQLFNEWKGSDLDIDEKAMEKNWLEIAAKLSDGPKIGKMVCFGTGTDGDHSGLMGMFKDPRSYNVLATPSGIGKTNWFTVGIDPYLADFETQGVITIWGKDSTGEVINRLTQGLSKYDMAWFERQYHMTADQYYKMLQNQDVQGVVWLKSRRVGQTQFYKDVEELAKYYGNKLGELPTFLTLNLKQQNDEIINVPRKVITITGGQEYSRSAVSSYRCAPAVTAEHTKYGQEPCRGQENPGSCKVS